MDRRTVPAELNGDLRDADLALQHTRDDAALGEGEMRRHGGAPRSVNTRKSSRVAFQNRTHPFTVDDYDNLSYVTFAV